METKNKKAFTLVEMIVSIAIIALISIALLGFVIPAMTMQQTAKARNESTYLAADELERKIYAMTEGNTDTSDGGHFTSQPYALTFVIDGVTYTCNGILVESSEPVLTSENSEEVNLRAFVPEKVN